MTISHEIEPKGHAESTDTASKHMIRDFCVASLSDTVETYLEKLRSHEGESEGIPYIYVTDHSRKLLGTVSLQKFLTCPKETKISDIMETKPVTVRPHTDRERVALLAIHNELKALPVVDAENRLIGIIPEQSILQILHEEHVEDFLRSAGIHHAGGPFIDVLKARTSKVLRARIPWLLIGLLGGMGATFIVKFFEASLEQKLGLAFFIPIILYMGAAVGVQSETLFLRSELLGPVNFKKYLWRESQIGPSLGLIIGSITFLFAWGLFKDKKLASAIGLAMFTTISVSVFIGIFIPFILQKLKKDPAIGSGPFATVVQDLLSLVIYFAIASAIIR